MPELNIFDDLFFVNARAALSSLEVPQVSQQVANVSKYLTRFFQFRVKKKLKIQIGTQFMILERISSKNRRRRAKIFFINFFLNFLFSEEHLSPSWTFSVASLQLSDLDTNCFFTLMLKNSETKLKLA